MFNIRYSNWVTNIRCSHCYSARGFEDRFLLSYNINQYNEMRLCEKCINQIIDKYDNNLLNISYSSACMNLSCNNIINNTYILFTYKHNNMTYCRTCLDNLIKNIISCRKSFILKNAIKEKL